MRSDQKKRRNQINCIIGGVIGVVFVGNLAIGIATLPSPKSKAIPSPSMAATPTPVVAVSPSPKLPIPPAMLALGEKTAKKTKADAIVWGSGMSGGAYAMVLLPRESWQALSKTEKAALTYYAEASIVKIRAKHPGMCDDCWAVTVSDVSEQPYGVDATVVAGDGVDLTDSNGDRAGKFRAAMLK
jgi:hypothetical protein